MRIYTDRAALVRLTLTLACFTPLIYQPISSFRASIYPIRYCPECRGENPSEEDGADKQRFGSRKREFTDCVDCGTLESFSLYGVLGVCRRSPRDPTVILASVKRPVVTWARPNMRTSCGQKNDSTQHCLRLSIPPLFPSRRRPNHQHESSAAGAQHGGQYGGRRGPARAGDVAAATQR